MANYSISILNSIRNEASEEYRTRVPEATQSNFNEIGTAITTHTPVFNEFCSALVHKIGKTIIEQKLFKNRLARFKSGAVTTQQDVEEIFVEMIKAEGAYDPNGTNPLGRRDYPDVHAIYHRMNRRDKYVLSLGDLDFKRAFTSEAVFVSFVKSMINTIYSSAAYDEWLCMKNLICTYAQDKTPFSYEINRVQDMAELASTTDALTGQALYRLGYNAYSVKDFLKTLKKAIKDLTVAPSTKYNVAGVNTWSEKSNLVLIIHKDLAAEIESEASMPEGLEIIELDDLKSPDRHAILMDADWFRVFDTLSHMETQRNADGLFTNYFYHVHQILSGSTFKNFVTFDCPEEI